MTTNEQTLVEIPDLVEEAALREGSLSTALVSVFRGRFCDVLLHGRDEVAIDKHAVLYDVGDEKKIFFFIRRGFVKVGTILSDGREIIYDIRKTGDVAGELCVSQHPRHDRAVALEEIRVIPVTYSEIVHTLQSNPNILTKLVEILSDCLADAYDQISTLAMHDILRRVASALLGLASKMGRPYGGWVQIPAYLTQEEISQLVAARRERVSTALNVLRRRRIIQYSHGGHFLLNLNSLKSVSA